MSGDELPEAIARWLCDRVQVPEHRAITASLGFLTLPEIAALRAKADAADRVRELHTQTAARVKGGEWICCGHDRVTWPCPTIRVLDGEEL